MRERAGAMQKRQREEKGQGRCWRREHVLVGPKQSMASKKPIPQTKVPRWVPVPKAGTKEDERGSVRRAELPDERAEAEAARVRSAWPSSARAAGRTARVVPAARSGARKRGFRARGL